jgi:hypothetical protein
VAVKVLRRTDALADATTASASTIATPAAETRLTRQASNGRPHCLAQSAARPFETCPERPSSASRQRRSVPLRKADAVRAYPLRRRLPGEASPAEVAKDGQHDNDDDYDPQPGRHVIPFVRSVATLLVRAPSGAPGTAHSVDCLHEHSPVEVLHDLGGTRCGTGRSLLKFPRHDSCR